MSMPATILVAHDFSASADAALAHARELAERTGARIHVVHVMLPSSLVPAPVTGMAAAVVSGEVVNALHDRAEASLADVVGRAGPNTTGHLVMGVPAVAICETAERIGADWIAMGIGSRSGLAHALLGSVTERTMRTATRPVLAVPAHSRAHDERGIAPERNRSASHRP